MSHLEDNDAMSRELSRDEQERRIEDLNHRLGVVSQLLTCALAKLGGEMAVTTTEIDRAVMGQQIALTPLPHDRGYYVSLVAHSPEGSNASATDGVPARRDGMFSGA